MFDAISPRYDLLNHLLSLNTDRRWRRKLARKVVSGVPVRRALDVCAGTGDLTFALADEIARNGGEAQICATDFVPGMIRIARRKSSERSGGKKAHTASVARTTILPIIADTLHLPFRDGMFDVVSVAFGIRNVADTAAGLREMTRVCRGGGRVAVLEFSYPRNPIVRAVYRLYFHSLLPLVGRLVSGTNAYRYLPGSVDRFPEVWDFRALLAEVAGGPVTVVSLSMGIATLYVADVTKSEED
jgi:demethylmenaquinone methyltransferase/2-methoxy-6-polyprenyl-1,4-benzoquinol methylase